MAKMTYLQKVNRVADQLPETPKAVPFLPVMIYVIERGCLAAGQSIPKIPTKGASEKGPSPSKQGSSASKVSPSKRVVARRPKEARSTGASDMDLEFTRQLQALAPEPRQRTIVLKRLAGVVANYKSLPDEAKLRFAPPELINLDASKIYDAKSFKPWFNPPKPPPDTPKVPPKITDLAPAGIPGAYKANTPFRIIGEGFSIGTANNEIVVSTFLKDIMDPDFKGPATGKEVEAARFAPDAAPKTTELRATVPSMLAPKAEPYHLRVEVTESKKTATSNMVDFKIVPNPTILESPTITTMPNHARMDSPLIITAGSSLGPAKVLKAGQGVTPGQKTQKVFIRASLIPQFGAPNEFPTVTIDEKGSAIEHLGGGGLKIRMPAEMHPGDYVLQLTSMLHASGLSISNQFLFDEKGGLSNLMPLAVRGPRYRLRFTTLACDDETSEASPTDEITAQWGCSFDTTPDYGGSSQYDMDADQKVPFRLTDKREFEGDAGKLMTVTCSLMEVDSGDSAAQQAVFEFIASLATAVAGVLGAFTMLIGAAIAGAVAGVAKGIAALLSGIGNADDPLGVEIEHKLKGADLRAQTMNGAKIVREFGFGADGFYRVGYEITRLT